MDTGLHPARDWPMSQVVVARDKRVLHLPIAKNASSSLNTLMIELSGHPERHKLLQNPHRLEASGLLLGELDLSEATALLEDPSCFRFAVVRDPVERLASAFLNKMVQTRTKPENTHATEIVAEIRGEAPPAAATLERGVSFKEFVGHILARPPEVLDTHWRPQILFLGPLDHLRLYTTDGLDVLAHDLSEHIGAPVRIPLRNQSSVAGGERTEGLAELLPGEIADPQQVSLSHFYTVPLRAAVEQYFAEDVTLFRRVDADVKARREALAAAGSKLDGNSREGAYLPPLTLRKLASLNGMRRLVGLEPVRRR